jgi:Flp pilus assembly pilin Flp
MKPLDLIKSFARSESGAVTVDWVVLTAAIVGLGIAVITAISSGVGGLGGSIERSLSGITITAVDVNTIHGGGGGGSDG